jgi:thioredoxin-like negative regulator of GroEL
MLQISNIDELNEVILNNPIVLLYFSTQKCNVCKTLKPKVQSMLANYPNAVSRYIDLEKFTEVTGKYTVFSIPTIIVLIDGKEYIRESRHFSLFELEQKIQRYYVMFYS